MACRHKVFAEPVVIEYESKRKIYDYVLLLVRVHVIKIVLLQCRFWQDSLQQHARRVLASLVKLEVSY